MSTNRMKTLMICMACLMAALVLIAAIPGPGTEYRLKARMVGNVEVPPGDVDGTGTAVFRLNPDLKTVCWQIRVTNITLPAFAAHIHAAPAGSTGSAVVTLTAPDASGASRGCTTAERRQILEIIRRPGQYYVNVHNTDFPGGAVRGQLSQ